MSNKRMSKTISNAHMKEGTPRLEDQKRMDLFVVQLIHFVDDPESGLNKCVNKMDVSLTCSIYDSLLPENYYVVTKCFKRTRYRTKDYVTLTEVVSKPHNIKYLEKKLETEFSQKNRNVKLIYVQDTYYLNIIFKTQNFPEPFLDP
jgi:hypothetical protein